MCYSHGNQYTNITARLENQRFTKTATLTCLGDNIAAMCTCAMVGKQLALKTTSAIYFIEMKVTRYE